MAGTIDHKFGTSHETFTTLRAKVIIAGDPAVGKTALCRMLVSNGSDYPKAYMQTAAMEVFSKTFRVTEAKIPTGAAAAAGGLAPGTVLKPEVPTRVELMLVDTPGSNVYNQREAGIKQWEACNCVAVVFDISNRESFKSVAKWLRKVEDCKAIAISEGKGYGSGKLHGYVLIGAKVDLRDADVGRGEVTAEEASAFAASLHMPYFEASAERSFSTGNVDKPFQYLAESVFAAYEGEVRRCQSTWGAGASAGAAGAAAGGAGASGK